MNASRRHYFSLLALLSVAGLAGNYLSLTLFHGVHFIFGSIAVLMAVKLLGLGGAAIVALISGTYTYFLWGHPYALIIFVSEAVVVSLLLRRSLSSLAIADFIFWLFVGLPMVWVFYSHAIGMGATQVHLIMMKQPVNGILNAIFATYFLYLLPKTFWPDNQVLTRGMGLREVIFTVMLTFSLLSTVVVIIYQNNLFRSYQEDALKNELELHAKYIKQSLPRNTGEANESLDLSSILNHVHNENSKRAIIVTTADNTILETTLPFSVATELISQERFSEKTENGMSLFVPASKTQSQMLRWDESMYYIKSSLNIAQPAQIYLLQHGSSITNRLQENIQTVFLALFLVTLVASVAAYFMCNLLSKAIIQLAQATKDLPDKIKHHSTVQWPVSYIYEINQLTQQSQMMAENIRENLSDVNSHSTAIIESSTNAIITADSHGLILSFNRAAEDLFGYHRHEIVGQSIKKLAPEKHLDNIDAYLTNPGAKLYAPNETSRYEMSGQHKSGSTFPMELSITEVELRSGTIFTAIITDITTRRANERLKRDFISTVSHELRTPLTSIKGSIKLLRGKIKKLSTEQSLDIIDIADRNVERLSDLINDLLDFEKLDSGKIDYDLEEINPAILIDSIVEESLPFANQTNIKLIHSTENSCKIRVDAKRFPQIIRNLISNAIKFSANGSSVRIYYERTAQFLKILVEDHGLGISDEFSDKIFQRFSQADSSDSREIQRGTGLGLAISKRLTEDMAGRIGFDSVEGQGSTFYLTFRISESD